MGNKNKNLKDKILIESIEVLSTDMPRNTNWHSFAARKRAAELIVNLIFKNYEIEKELIKREGKNI